MIELILNIETEFNVMDKRDKCSGNKNAKIYNLIIYKRMNKSYINNKQ